MILLSWDFLFLFKNFYLFIFKNFYLFIYLFIYFWLCWVFVAVHRLSLVAASGGYSVVVRRLLIMVASLVAVCGL